jgi:hypothetical protein
MMENLTMAAWAMPDQSVTIGTGLTPESRMPMPNWYSWPPVKMPMPDKLILGIWAFRHLLMIFQNRKANFTQTAAGYGHAGRIPFLLPTVFVNVSPVPE